MAFAITKCKAYGLQTGAPTRSKGFQVVELQLTGLNTDVDLDLGDDTGTFWTAVATSSPNCYASVLALLQNISANTLAFMGVQGEQLVAREKVASPGQVLNFASAISVGGAAAEAYVVTGLKTTDTVIAVTQKTDGAGAAVGILSYGTLVANGLTVTYNADPGANAVVNVVVLRAIAAGQYSVAIENNRPNLLFLSGDAPTAYQLVLVWQCGQTFAPVTADFEE